MTYLMGIDIGTTASKGVLVTPQGNLVAQARLEHAVSRPRPGWAEHDADKIWMGDFVSICKTLLQQSQINPQDIASVGYSTLYPVLVPINARGRPLRQGILYGIDTRAVKEIETFKEKLGEDYCRRTSGNGITTHTIAPKILWIRNNEPEIFAETYKFLNAGAYITYCLTGRVCIDHGSASLGGIPYRIDAGGWDETVLNICGITKDQMPELVWANEIAGRISKEAAAETGLAEGTIVTPGTGDRITESLSQGIFNSGKISISCGTTFGVDVCSDSLVTYPGLTVTRSCFKDLFFIGGATFNGCSITNWFRDNLARFNEAELNRNDFDAFASLDREAAAVPPGCEGLIALPYFSGEKVPFFDVHARGVLFGLKLYHSGKHIYRALLESAAFSIRHILDVIQEAGFSSREMVVSTGGGTKSGVWTQIISDITGLNQQILKQLHGSPMGAAFLGGLAAGVIRNKEEIFIWQEIEREVSPNPELKTLYDNYYKIYRELYKNTNNLMQLL
jgi:xylulokinase